MRAYLSKNIWVVIVCSLTVLLATSTAATANGRWVQNHPRRAVKSMHDLVIKISGFIKKGEKVKSVVHKLDKCTNKIVKYAVKSVKWLGRMVVI